MTAQAREIDPIIERVAAGASEALGGASVSVGVRRGSAPDVVCSRGFADLENDIHALPHSVYRIGSLTKQFTAAAVMLLVERGALGLEDELDRLIPEYPPTGHGITVRHLLTHTSGIANYTELPEFAEKVRLDLRPRELAALFASRPLDFPPGARYAYSNSGYYLLGVIIERVAALTYAEFMQREFFTPLALRETFYLDDYRIIRHRVHGYDTFQDQLVNASAISMTSPFAAGAPAAGLPAPGDSKCKETATRFWHKACVTHRYGAQKGSANRPRGDGQAMGARPEADARHQRARGRRCAREAARHAAPSPPDRETAPPMSSRAVRC